MCICLQCARCKQNRYRFLVKTDTIDKCAITLSIISIVYLIGQSLVKILSQISADKCKLKFMAANVSACSLFAVQIDFLTRSAV